MEHSRIETQRPQHLLKWVNRVFFFSFLQRWCVSVERERADGAGSLVWYMIEETRPPPLLGKPFVYRRSDETNDFIGSDTVTAYERHRSLLLKTAVHGQALGKTHVCGKTTWGLLPGEVAQEALKGHPGHSILRPTCGCLPVLSFTLHLPLLLLTRIGQMCNCCGLSDNYVAQKYSGINSPSFVTSESRRLLEQESSLNETDIRKSWGNMGTPFATYLKCGVFFFF